MLSLPVANSPHGGSDRNAHPIPHAGVSALNVEHHALDGVIDAAIPVFPSAADIDAPESHAMIGAAPRPISGSFVLGVFVALLVLAMLGLGWSGMVDDLNQTIAQIYLLNLLVAANG